jgi:hypothetical protein
MLFGTLLLFASTTTFWVLGLVCDGKDYDVVLIDHPEMTLAQRFSMVNNLRILVDFSIANDWLVPFNVRSFPLVETQIRLTLILAVYLWRCHRHLARVGVVE